MAKAGKDLYRVKKSEICGHKLAAGLAASSGIGSHTKITLFSFNLIALEKKRWSVCFCVNLSNKHVSTKLNIFPIIFKNPPKTLIVPNPLLTTHYPQLSDPEGLQIIEPFICDRLVFIYEDTATKRGFQ